MSPANNYYAKFEYKGMKSVLITDYTQITQCKHSKGGVDLIMSKLNTPKNIIRCAQNIGCTHVECVNNHNIQSLNMKE